MKKFFILFILIFFLISCSMENQQLTHITETGDKIISEIEGKKIEIENVKKIPSKEGFEENKIVFHFDYPIFKNSKIDKIIKTWGETLIETKKQEYKNKRYGKLESPEMFFVFEKYSKDSIIFVVYKIVENLYLGKKQEYVKTFYIDKNGNDTHAVNLFLKEKKALLSKILVDELQKLDYNYKKDLSSEIQEYLKNPKFYIDNSDIIFLFDSHNIDISNLGIIKIKIELQKIENFLNPLYFDSLKTNIINTEIAEKAQNPAITQEKTSKDKQKVKYVALTFDDGPNKDTTPKLLEILKKYNVKATFFVLGKNASYFPDVVKKEYDEGHEIGNHSRSHPNLPFLNKKKLKDQVDKTDKEIEKITGTKPKVFRPPYGNYNKTVKKAIGRTLIIWNVDSMDRKNKDLKKNLETSLNEVKNGSIILFHDIYKSSIETIPYLIENLQDQGYEFLTVSELLEKGQVKDRENKACYSAFFCKY